jgi:hypothetical protein
VTGFEIQRCLTAFQFRLVFGEPIPLHGHPQYGRALNLILSLLGDTPAFFRIRIRKGKICS